MNAVRQTSYSEAVEKHFLRALLYFDIFNYPLTAVEVARYSPAIVNFSPDRFLEDLVSRKMLFRFENFYALQEDPQIALRRLKGNALAEKKMKTAKKFSYLVSLFPFVRAVMLSGSISKGYMDERSDIDYFIVTETNRLRALPAFPCPEATPVPLFRSRVVRKRRHRRTLRKATNCIKRTRINLLLWHTKKR